jgi:hypothetical protein
MCVYAHERERECVCVSVSVYVCLCVSAIDPMYCVFDCSFSDVSVLIHTCLYVCVSLARCPPLSLSLSLSLFYAEELIRRYSSM